MAQVIPFPRRGALPNAEPIIKPVELQPAAATKLPTKAHPGTGRVVSVLATVYALLWPLIRIVLTVDVVYQFFRLLWGWSSGGLSATLVFGAHFGLLVAGYLLIAEAGKHIRR